VFLPGEDVDANFQQLVQAGAVTITTDGFHAKGTAQALAQIPIEESDAAAIAS
jgi:cystathionine beta-lyase